LTTKGSSVNVSIYSMGKGEKGGGKGGNLFFVGGGKTQEKKKKKKSLLASRFTSKLRLRKKGACEHVYYLPPSTRERKGKRGGYKSESGLLMIDLLFCLFFLGGREGQVENFLTLLYQGGVKGKEEEKKGEEDYFTLSPYPLTHRQRKREKSQ